MMFATKSLGSSLETGAAYTIFYNKACVEIERLNTAQLE